MSVVYPSPFLSLPQVSILFLSSFSPVIYIICDTCPRALIAIYLLCSPPFLIPSPAILKVFHGAFFMFEDYLLRCCICSLMLSVKKEKLNVLLRPLPMSILFSLVFFSMHSAVYMYETYEYNIYKI